MTEQPTLKTLLFTDIEGSSRLWEQHAERMATALAGHDAILRQAVARNNGQLVKATGDGMLAAFDDPRNALLAAVDMQGALRDESSTAGLPLHIRCGIHAGVVEWRDGDYYGNPVNRAARIMSVAHGGQALLSQTVADLIRDHVPSGVTLRDLGAVRLRDLANAERLYQIEHANLRADFPPLRTLEGIPNNLPQQLTTFIGRERVLAEIKSAFEGSRLLTLSGIGGLGKTRLSLQLAADVVSDFPDGVWFVELAPLGDARLLPQAVASVLGVKEEPGRSVSEALAAFVSERRLLIVLDNCEHLVQACAELAKQLLQAGERLKILASSREHFNVAGETVYTVPPLSVPDAAGTASIDALMAFEAVRLFVERAAAVQHAFRLTEQNAAAVVEICQRLDGIPLALELAAARVRALSVEQIATRVNDRFRLLASGDRTLLPRQQTLRAMIDWSHDLLTEHEAILFRRLSVFAGGWTLEAAEAVASGGSVERADVLDLLAELVNKSLVVLDRDTGRYHLLETVRQYAAERLRESADRQAARAQHLEFYLALAENARPELAGASRGEWLSRLDSDRQNILWAHRRAARDDMPVESAYRLVHAIKPYWFNRGLLHLGYGVTLDIVARNGTASRTAQRADALLAAGQIAAYMGRYAEAERHLLDSIEIARELGNDELIAAVLQPLSLAALGRGDREAARRYGSEALDLAQKLGDKLDIAGASNALAQLHRLDGDVDAAEKLYDQMLAISREAGNTDYEAVGLLNLAMVAISRRAVDRARTLLLDVIAIAEKTGSKPAGLSALEVAAGLATLREDWLRAARLYGMADLQTRDSGIQRDPADDAFLQPLVAKTRQTLGDRGYNAACASGRALSYEQAIEETRAWLASVA